MHPELYASFPAILQAVSRILVLLICASFLSWNTAVAQPVMEKLGRGIVVVRTGETAAYIGWRLLATDPSSVGFNVYRAAGDARPRRLNTALLTTTTDFVDT